MCIVDLKRIKLGNFDEKYREIIEGKYSLFTEDY